MVTPEERNYNYSTTGICLTCPIILNQDPSDIESVGGHPAYFSYSKWNTFYNFIYGYNSDDETNPWNSAISARQLINFNPEDTKLNSSQYYQELTQTLINKFNTDPTVSLWAKLGNQYPHIGTNNPLTKEDIQAVQKFNHKSDSTVIIDEGWLGTQSVRLKYPSTRTITSGIVYNGKRIEPNIKNYLLPVIWGNKRYVLPVDKLKDIGTIYLYLVPYDPTIHTKDKFQQYTKQLIDFYGRSLADKDPDKWSDWKNLGPTISLTPSAEQINSQTTKNQADTSNKANQTSIIKSINK